MIKNRVPPFVFFIVLAAASVLLVPITAVAPSPGTEHTINFICRQMEEFAFCSQTFLQNLPEADADNVTLTRIAVVESEKSATNTLEFIQTQLLPREQNPDRHNNYVVCQNAYQILQQSFKQALDALNNGDYRGMELYERDTPRVIGSCTTIFQIPPVTSYNPLYERNRHMRILLTMAIVAGDFIIT